MFEEQKLGIIIGLLKTYTSSKAARMAGQVLPVRTLQATRPLLIYRVVPSNSCLYASESSKQVSTFYYAAGMVLANYQY
jgi:hypothetical protein